MNDPYTTTPAALRAARSASQQVRDDALHAEVIVLRTEVANLRLKFECSQASLKHAVDLLGYEPQPMTHDGVRLDKAIRPRGGQS